MKCPYCADQYQTARLVERHIETSHPEEHTGRVLEKSLLVRAGVPVKGLLTPEDFVKAMSRALIEVDLPRDLYLEIRKRLGVVDRGACTMCTRSVEGLTEHMMRRHGATESAESMD